MALNDYISQVQSLIHDPAAQRYSTQALTTFINTGRRQLALRGECVRYLYGVDGVSFGNNNTSANIEQYMLPQNVDPTIGIQALIGCRGVAINYGGAQSSLYSLRYRDWTWFQAYVRSYPTLTGNPVYWTRYQNKIYLRPIPAQPYPMQWDCQATVVNLVDDSTPEAIPYSYTDAVQYFAAYLAFMSSQRKDDAKNMKDIYESFIREGRRNDQSTFVPDIYDEII